MGDKGMKKLEQLWQTFLSVVKILLQSKWRTRSDVLINSTLIFAECLDKSTAFAAFCSINLLFF